MHQQSLYDLQNMGALHSQIHHPTNIPTQGPQVLKEKQRGSELKEGVMGSRATLANGCEALLHAASEHEICILSDTYA